MKIRPSQIEGVEIGASPVENAVAVRNCAALPIAFLGVRFDMIKPDRKPAASMHYSDMLRFPERSDFVPGIERIVSVEHGITEAIRRGIPPEEMPDFKRISLNLQTLRKMLSITASLDCVAFTDGTFQGPDVGGAFTRLEEERQQEENFLDTAKRNLREALKSAPKRFANLNQLFETDGANAVLEAISHHRIRIPLVNSRQ